MELKQKAKKLLKIISISSATTGAIVQILSMLSIAVPMFIPIVLFGVCIFSMVVFFSLPKTLHEKIELIFDNKTTEHDLITIKERIEEELKKEGTVYNQPIHITLPK